MRDKSSLIVLFTVSMATLGMEVLLTRVFAVVLFSSHSFLAISLTLLGSGAGAIIAYLGAPTPEDKQVARKTILLAALALAVVISVYTLMHVEFVPRELQDPDTGKLGKDLTYNKRSTMIMLHPELFQMWKLYAVIPIVFLPFLVSGYLQAFIFRHAPKQFSIYYGIDLLAANLGAVTIPLLLYPLGLTWTIVAVVAVVVSPTIYLFLSRLHNWRLAALTVAPLILAIVVGALGGFKVKHPAGFAEKKVIREYWTPMSRVSLMRQSKDQEMYVIDNASRTFYAPQNDREVRRYTREMFNIPFAMKAGGKALIIASGGGQEIIMADKLGIKDIDAVEIAGPIIRDIVNKKKNEPGNPYLLPSVNWFIADGRSVVKRTKKIYDVIEMLEVNFHTMAGQVSQAWSPYFVFTQEAFGEYLDRLNPNGYLCYTFFSRGDSPVGGDKSCRFRSIIAGMYEDGIKKPEDHFAVFVQPHGYGFRSMVMAKKSPYEPEELAQMMRVADRCKGEITIQYPDLRPLRESGAITDEELMRWQPIAKWIGPVAEMCRKSRPLKGLLANIKTAPSFNTAVNDDRPFMYGSGFRRINSPQEKMIRELYRNLLIIMVALAVVFIALPLFVSKADSGEKVRLDPRLLAILLLTGLGFMFVEMSGIFKYQLYMHHPTIAMIVILAGMILGAGLGSLHSDRIGEERKEGAIPFYAAISAVGALALLFFLPLYGHGLMLWLPLEALLPIMFVLFAGLGFFMGHVVPLAIGAFARNQERLLAWCWAITVTGSVFGTVIASILSRDYGMYVIIALGVACYLGVVLTVLIGKLATRKKPAAAAA